MCDLQQEFVYVAVVLDAHSRRVIGWAVARHLGASVAVQALRMALVERQPAPGLIHHSDRGIQYACADYLTLLADHGVQPSMSRVGNPYDNAKAESFMKTLKQEQVRGNNWRDLEALRADLTTFFEITYNHQRLHSALGLSNAGRLRTAVAVHTEPRSFYKADWGEGANRPLAPDPTPRFTIFHTRKLSLVSLSHVRGAVQLSGPGMALNHFAGKRRDRPTLAKDARMGHPVGWRSKMCHPEERQNDASNRSIKEACSQPRG